MGRTEKLEITICDFKFQPEDCLINWETDEFQLTVRGVRKLFKLLKEHGMVFKDRPTYSDMYLVEELDLKEKE